jgi:hypothetical protein
MVYLTYRAKKMNSYNGFTRQSFSGIPYRLRDHYSRSLGMNERCQGAFEALAWVEDMIVKSHGSPHALESLLRQVREMIAAVKSGVADDFPFRLRANA